jgi:hypothetical protein
MNSDDENNNVKTFLNGNKFNILLIIVAVVVKVVL